ncbi:MAG: class I SAM-dependent methyltransferase [Saprospiraceae bacterium]|nr:class I SAM-dependent methyltransferase [Saprospiraceae bacterium]
MQLTASKNILELGVFTGYSTLSMAFAIPEQGRIVACDISDEWKSIARKYLQEAGVQQKIHLHLAPALQTLKEL